MSLKYSRNQMTILKRELKKMTLICRSITVRKRLNQITKVMLQSNEIYETEIQSLQLKNRMLARANQFEKECSRRLGDERLSVQRAFLDMCRENALLKSDLKEMERIIANYDQEFKKSLIPNLVQLSDDITKMMMSNATVLKNIENKRNEINDVSFPRNSWSNKSSNGFNTSQPVSTVNPMIKGCVIQKPTINVRRVSFPEERRNALFSNVAISSPIMEESEESLETIINISNNGRKCKNGLRRAMIPNNRLATHSASNDTVNLCETLETATHRVNLLMEPIVRLQDVTRMLQNSSIQLTETDSPVVSPQESNLISYSPEIQLKRIPITLKTSSCASPISSENALEGCSWMYQTTSPSPVLTINSPACRVCVKNSPIFKKVQSNDETDDSSVAKSSPTEKTSNRFENSLRRSLLLRNCTKRPRRSCRSSIAKKTREKESENVAKQDQISLDPSDSSKIFRPSTRGSSCSFSLENANNANPNEVEGKIEENRTNRHDTTHIRRRAKLFTRISTEPDVSSVAKESVVEPVSRESTKGKGSLRKTKRKSSECNNTDESLSVSNVDNGSRPRRSGRKQNISYKEPSLHRKMRRNS